LGAEEWTPGQEMDVAFECAGENGAVDDAIEAARPGGRVILVGIPGEDRTSFTASTARRKGLTIKLSRRMKHTYPRAIRLVESGRVDVRSLVTHRFPLEQVAEAFAAAQRREGLRRDARHDRAGDIPRPHRSDGLRHARHRGSLRYPGRAGERDCDRRRIAGKEQTADADLRRRDGTRAEGDGLATDPRAWLRDVWAVAAGRAAGGYDSIFDAAPKMARLKAKSFIPNPGAQKVYDQLYGEYLTLHDYFGRGANEVMKRLKQIKAAARNQQEPRDA
jgi:hypothetical protein